LRVVSLGGIRAGGGAGGGVGVASSEWPANNLVVQQENAKKRIKLEN